MTDHCWQVDEQSVGSRLDRFLAATDRLGSRGRAAAALQRGKVFVNDEEAGAADAGRRLMAGECVRVWMDRPGTARRRIAQTVTSGDLPIVYEDDALIVVNKPPGLLTVPLERRYEASSVYEHLARHLRSRGKRKPLVVHRIDRDTSGLVVFAKRADVQTRLKDQFRRHEAERIYLAIVYGHPSPASGMWRDYLVWDQRALIQKQTHPRDPRGKEARCEYRVVESYRDASLVEIRLITGRQNQIRLQARLRGHTLVGEQRYVPGREPTGSVPFRRQALHAYRLGFRHPRDGRPLHLEAPLAADLAELVARLRKS